MRKKAGDWHRLPIELPVRNKQQLNLDSEHRYSARYLSPQQTLVLPMRIGE
jgi:hypothetical protein